MNLFKAYGPINSAKIELDAENVSKGFAFVCFESGDDARKAMLALNGKKFGELEL